MNLRIKNRLIVFGNKEDLERFKKEAAGENGCLDMNSFISAPMAYRNQNEINELRASEMAREEESEGEGFSGEKKTLAFAFRFGAYSWRMDNWGSDSNFCHLFFESAGNDKIAVYGFETAYDAPIPVIFKMGERFPMLSFELRYAEEDLTFYGILMIEGGRIVLYLAFPDSLNEFDAEQYSSPLKEIESSALRENDIKLSITPDPRSRQGALPWKIR